MAEEITHRHEYIKLKIETIKRTLQFPRCRFQTLTVSYTKSKVNKAACTTVMNLSHKREKWHAYHHSPQVTSLYEDIVIPHKT